MQPFTRAATLGLLALGTVLLWLCPLAAIPVPVRFAEGVTHGFLVLRSAGGPLIASGDLLAWIVTGDVPAFVGFEGPLYPTGPVWRIELTSPRWPD